jgi:hypothetical protein
MRTIVIGNPGKDPGPNSHRKIQVTCESGHTYQITASLAKSRGCPLCAGLHTEKKGS